MPVPARNVVATIKKTNGTSPSVGSIRFKRTRQVTDGTQIYSLDPVTVTLTAGAITTSLVPSSSGTAAAAEWVISPTGVLYEVMISVDDLPAVTYFVDIPAGDSTLDLKDLIPDSAIPDGYMWETIGRAEFDAAIAAVVAGASPAPLHGTGAPTGGLGVNKSWYVDQANGKVYFKESGSWVEIFDAVLAAEVPTLVTDAVWTFSAGTPSNGTGKNNDLAFDTTNHRVYKRISGVYVLQYQLPTGGGAGLTTFLTGSGVPAGGTGSDGNYYIRTVADPAPDELYLKTAGVWALVTYFGRTVQTQRFTAIYKGVGPTGYGALYDPANEANYYQVPTTPATRSHYFLDWVQDLGEGNPTVSAGWLAPGEFVRVIPA